MIATRRRLILGLGAAALLPRTGPARAADPVEIAMGGSDDGGHVWFDPLGLQVEPGSTIRWTNRDPRNAHTATAYHPENQSRLPRIPAGAEPWDSGYLLPGEAFSVTLTVPGVYDYFCVPHEAAGMVGRIVVGTPGADGTARAAVPAKGDLPRAALEAFPPVSLIAESGTVRAGQGGKGGH